jgi:predicted transcriptional regulator
MSGKKFQITLSQEVSKKLEKLAKEKGISKSSIVALALCEMMKKEAKTI